MPLKRNLQSKFTRSTDARTGGHSKSDKGEVNSPRKETNRHEIPGDNDLRYGLEQTREKDLRSKLVGQAQQCQREESWEAARERKGKDKVGSSYGGRHASEVGKEDYGPGMHGDQGRRSSGASRGRFLSISSITTQCLDMTWIGRVGMMRSFATQGRRRLVFDRISVNNEEAGDPGRQGCREK